MSHRRFRQFQTLGQNNLRQASGIWYQASGCKFVQYIEQWTVSRHVKQKGWGYKLSWKGREAVRKLGVLHENRFVPLVSQAPRLELRRHDFALICLVYIVIKFKTTNNGIIRDHSVREDHFFSSQLTFVLLADKACIFRASKQIMKEWCFCTKHIQISLINDRQLGHKMHLTAASKASFVWI